MGRPIQPAAAPRRQRVDWVDYAKGFCIVFVVMMHSTLGVENAAGQEGWLHAVVEFAKPFRMPDFFLISGLFLAQVIDRDWRTYLDRKVVHFAYFYLLWTAIQFAFKAPLFVQEHGVMRTAWLYVESLWEPFGTLWFIYLLPIFFVVTKLAHNLRIPAIAVWLVGAALEIAHIHTGFTVVDEFASRFVYFYTGYLFAPHIFALAERWREFPEAVLAGIAIWGLLNACWCSTASPKCRSSRSPSVWPARARSWRSRSCWRRPIWPRRCAIVGGTRSSSTSRSSCRWR